jgi:hypothetical protein
VFAKSSAAADERARELVAAWRAFAWGVGENAYGDGVWAYAPPQDDGSGGSNGSVALSAGALALLEGEVGSSSSSSSAAPAANLRNARLAATAAVPQGPRARLAKLNLLENNLTAEQALVSGGSTPSPSTLPPSTLLFLIVVTQLYA